MALASPGLASSVKRSDPNDTSGPLDLSGVVARHVQGGTSFEIKTQGGFTNADLGAQPANPGGYFEVGLDTNFDHRYNYFAEVRIFSGHLGGILFTRSGDLVDQHLKTSRVSARAVKVTVPHSQINPKGSLRFGVLSTYLAAPCSIQHPCSDRLPNRAPHQLILEDFTAPTIDLSLPNYSTKSSATLTFPVSFSVKDDRHGSGVKAWTLQQKEVGTSNWVRVKKGSGHTPTVDVTGQEGATYDFRVRAVDRQGNKRVSGIQTTSVPFDDRNALLAYSSSTQNGGVPDAFLGTTSSVEKLGTMSVTPVADVSDLCVVRGPTTGAAASAQVSGGDGTVPTLDEDGSTPPRSVTCIGPVSSGTAVTFTTTSDEPFVFDGAILVP